LAGFFEVVGLEERRKALAAESEVHRETLRLEVQNLRLGALTTQRRLAVARSTVPVLLLAAPLLLRMFSRPPQAERPKCGLLAKGLFAWRMCRQFSPFIANLFRRQALRTTMPPPQETPRWSSQ
jgi:hypothetical protein